MAARRQTSSRRRTSRKQQQFTNNQIAMLALVAVLVSSFGTYILLDSGAFNITGATLANGTVDLTVAAAAGCAMQTNNDTVNFGTVAAGATERTNDGDATGGTLVLNNTGNGNLNVTARNTNASSGFFSGASVASTDYRIKAGANCEANGDANGGGITTTYSDSSVTFRDLVNDFTFASGSDSCTIDFEAHVPVDEPAGVKHDQVIFNCTLA